jgi:ABC-type branched-subunit amino acid transport system ATPase component
VPVLAFERVTKRFGTLTAVDQLSFAAEADESLGFLGPNGAGKTMRHGMVPDIVREQNRGVRGSAAALAKSKSLATATAGHRGRMITGAKCIAARHAGNRGSRCAHSAISPV